MEPIPLHGLNLTLPADGVFDLSAEPSARNELERPPHTSGSGNSVPQSFSLQPIQTTMRLDTELNGRSAGQGMEDIIMSSDNVRTNTMNNPPTNPPMGAGTAPDRMTAQDSRPRAHGNGLEDSINSLIGLLRRRTRSSRMFEETDGNMADHEDETFNGPPQRPKCQTKRLRREFYHPGYQAKPTLLNRQKEAVRAHLRKLMKRNKKDPLPHPPSEFDLQHFKQDQPGSGPTAETYLIHYKEAPSSKWNERAFLVFSQTFMETTRFRELFKDAREGTDQQLSVAVLDDIAEKKLDLVKKMWIICFRGLRGQYKWQETTLRDPLTHQRRKEKSNRDRRRQTLFYRRLETAYSNVEFRPHIQILRQLGPVAMSSDESAVEDDRRVYTVFTRAWLNPLVRLFFRRLDEAHLRSRKTDFNRYTPGNLPHPRTRPATNTHVSTRYPVRFLPRNLYSPEWYQRLSQTERRDLKVKETEYDIYFSPPRDQGVPQDSMSH